MPPNQRLLFGLGPCYLLTVVIACAELRLGQGGDLLLVGHCFRAGDGVGKAKNLTLGKTGTDGANR